MRCIIDRFEGDIAVLETDQGMLNVPRSLFENAKEGDTVEITVEGKSVLSAEKDDDNDSPSKLFQRLRKKSRKKE